MTRHSTTWLHDSARDSHPSHVNSSCEEAQVPTRLRRTRCAIATRPVVRLPSPTRCGMAQTIRSSFARPQGAFMGVTRLPRQSTLCWQTKFKKRSRRTLRQRRYFHRSWRMHLPISKCQLYSRLCNRHQSLNHTTHSASPERLHLLMRWHIHHIQACHLPLSAQSHLSPRSYITAWLPHLRYRHFLWTSFLQTHGRLHLDTPISPSTQNHTCLWISISLHVDNSAPIGILRAQITPNIWCVPVNTMAPPPQRSSSPKRSGQRPKPYGARTMTHLSRRLRRAEPTHSTDSSTASWANKLVILWPKFQVWTMVVAVASFLNSVTARSWAQWSKSLRQALLLL